MKESRIRKRTAILFIVAIMLLGIVGVILFRSGQMYIKLDELRREHRDIIISSQEVESLTKDIWGATRGFVIVGEEDFLKPLNEAKRHIQEPLNNLKALTDSMPASHEKVILLSGLVGERIRKSDEIIGIRKEKGFEAARAEVMTRAGQTVMDNIKQVSKQIREVSRAELLQLRETHRASERRTLTAFIVLLACVAFILIMAYRFINKAYGSLARAEQELKHLNQDLDEKVKDRTRELAHQVNQFHALTESLPQIIWTAEPSGQIDYVNHQWTEYTGKPLDSAKHKGWTEVVHPDDVHKAAEQWLDAVKKRATYEAEYRMRRADGEYYWFLVRAYPLKDDFGNIYKWTGTCTDIDQQKQMLDMRDEFISLTSHELRTPITTIKAYVQLLEGCLTEDEDCDAIGYLKKTHVFVDRLSLMVSDLHENTKAVAGKLQLMKGSFNFMEFIKEMIVALQQTNNQHSIILTGSADITVTADIARLQQVFTNYISNAIKYSPEGDKVLVNLSVENNHVIVAVRDFGIGIPKDKIDKIFTRFFRAGNTGTIEGLGLGLFLTKKIIGAHGGKAWVESEEGKGSTFFFCIPVFSNDQL